METFKYTKDFNAPTQAVNTVAKVLSDEGKIESIEGKTQEEINAMLLGYFDTLFSKVARAEIEALLNESSKKQLKEMVEDIFN